MGLTENNFLRVFFLLYKLFFMLKLKHRITKCIFTGESFFASFSSRCTRGGFKKLVDYINNFFYYNMFGNHKRLREQFASDKHPIKWVWERERENEEIKASLNLLCIDKRMKVGRHRLFAMFFRLFFSSACELEQEQPLTFKSASLSLSHSPHSCTIFKMFVALEFNFN